MNAPPRRSATFITFLADDARGARGAGAEHGLRVAVKDCIDVAGVVTTVGSAVVAAQARPAAVDAACLAGVRAAGARIVGKANLHELCFGATGVNPHYGTPVNPLDPARIPGGSSSGSAVAVASGEADIAFGTDTAGSVRNPAACCGVVGLKTTHGRVPVEGVWPLAPSMDTIGPMARDVAGVAAGMALLEPGFAASPDPWSELRHGREGHGSGSASRGHATPAGAAEPGGPAAGEVVGRLRGLEVDPVVDAAVDAALQAVGLIGTDVELDGWMAAHEAGRVLMFHEGLRSNADWYPRHRAGLGADVVARFDTAAAYDPSVVSEAYGTRDRWQAELGAALQRVGLLVLAGYPSFPPRLDEADPSSSVAAVAASLAGVPALVLPIPVVPVAGSAVPRTADGRAFPASLQLVGPWGSEELLVAVGARIEAAVRAGRGPS